MVKVRRDVDGDKKADSVVLENLRDSTHRYRLTVITAKGVRANINFTTLDDISNDTMWVGTAPLDDTPGVEMKLLTAFGDCGHYTIFTWRKNKLVHLGGPDGVWSTCADPDVGYSGYVFSRINGKRAVEQAHLIPQSDRKHYTGKAITYQWQGSAWKKMKSRTITLTPKQSAIYTQWTGLTFTK